MGDRASVTLYGDLKAWPPSVLEQLVDEFGGNAFGDGEHSFIWEEISVGSVLDGEIPTLITKAFTAAGVDFDFDIWQDPKYEYLGDVFRHRVGQEDFLGACDAAGNVLIAEQILRSFADGHLDSSDLADLLGPEALDFGANT